MDVLCTVKCLVTNITSIPLSCLFFLLFSSEMFRNIVASASKKPLRGVQCTLRRPHTQTTVNAEEVEKFSRMSATWWDPEGPFKPLHTMNPCRMRFITQRIGEHFKGLPITSSTNAHKDAKSILQSSPIDFLKKLVAAPQAPVDPNAYKVLEGLDVLDVGSGGGLLCESLARLSPKSILGIDASPDNVKMATAHAALDPKLAHLRYQHITAEALLQQGRQFDVVTSVEVVEHVNDPQLFVATCLQLVKPGGLLFLSTMNRTLASYAMAIIGAEQVLKWVPPGTHEWNKFLSPAELEGLVVNAPRTDIVLPTPESVAAAGNLENPSLFSRRTADVSQTVSAGMIYRPYPLDDWVLNSDNFDVNYIMAFTVQK